MVWRFFRTSSADPRPESPLSRARRRMVREQLAGRDVRDPRVLAAMGRVPRERFVPEDRVPDAYADRPLPIGEGQTISQPYMVARMTELLALRGGERVLEIGTGSGYQTALLAELAAEVFTIERLTSLAEAARHRLAALGYRTIRFRQDDGTRGWPEAAPFDRILVTAAGPRVPLSLLRQLGDPAILLMPVGCQASGKLRQVVRREGRDIEHELMACRFVPLVGAEGYEAS